MNVPVFDKSVDYLARFREQLSLSEQMRGLYEDHSVDNLNLLKQCIWSQKRIEKLLAAHTY